MKRFLRCSFYFTIASFLILTASSCVKDTCKKTYRIYTPQYKKLSQVRAEMTSQPAEAIASPGKLYVYGNYIFLNERGKGVHIIDNSNPAAPRNTAFIKIPGSYDMAVKGNYLYADSYSDLVVLDISNPNNVTPKKFIDNILKDYGIYWGNQTDPAKVDVLVGYSERDTTVDCNYPWFRWGGCANCAVFDSRGGAVVAAPVNGVSGSMARLTIAKDYLYGVSTSSLYSFSLEDASNPKLTANKMFGWGIETIYPFRDKLFIGSTSGMFIYDITNPSNPAAMGQFSHVRSCDPVIADDDYAFVTLRSGTTCQGFNNQLDILDIKYLSSPTLLKTYQMTNPHGLSKDGNLLFICDGKDGLKIYDCTNLNDLQLVKRFKELNTYDVIAMNGIAILVAEDGLYQFDYTNKNNIRMISRIAINK
jgi:hypothetical protein